MTAEQFRRLAIKLFGPERGWQTRCAEALGTDRASVSRWLSGAVSTVPGPVAAAMECWDDTFRREAYAAGWRDAVAALTKAASEAADVGARHTLEPSSIMRK